MLEKQIENTRYLVSTLGHVRFITKQKNVKEIPDKDGYVYVLIRSDKVLRKRLSVLVAKAFIPNPNNLPQVNHKNGNKLDNCVDNLEWVSGIDNIKHSWKTGLNKNNLNNELSDLSYPIINGLKVCSRCHKNLPTTSYYKRKYGCVPKCRECYHQLYIINKSRSSQREPERAATY